jgi:CheY-like chemotaxis protein
MGKRILVVDDEPDILESIKMLVETMGYEVETTEDGDKAIDMLKKEKFDLVLLDMLMPKISGIKTLEKIRANPEIKNQKVAFLTVVGLNQTGENFVKKLKPIEYIEKPIDNAEFKKKIKKILEP